MADEFDIYVMKRKPDKVEKELLEVKIKKLCIAERKYGTKKSG